MPQEPNAERKNNTLFNLSDFMRRQHQTDQAKFQDATQRSQPQEAQRMKTRAETSQAAVRALAENRLNDPLLGPTIRERIMEVHQELEKTRQTLTQAAQGPQEYFRTNETYQRLLKYYTGPYKNYTEFLASAATPNQAPAKAPATPEAAKPKVVRLQFGDQEHLLPQGDEKSAWASGNARYVEKALLRAFRDLGVELPFPPEDIISGMARAPEWMPTDIHLEPNKLPPLWLQYKLVEQVNGRMMDVQHAVSSYSELMQLLDAFQKGYPDDLHPAGRIAINMRKDVAQ